MQSDLPAVTANSTARKCGVLVVDDEPGIRDVLEDGLRQEGFSVWLAADGHEALGLYRNYCETIDVVLLDVLMPLLDGPTTLVKLQELRPEIPCCFMSGNLGYYTEEGLRHYGARAVLKKPFCLTEVAQTLRDVVESGELNPARNAAGGDTLHGPHSVDEPRFVP